MMKLKQTFLLDLIRRQLKGPDHPRHAHDAHQPHQQIETSNIRKRKGNQKERSQETGAEQIVGHERSLQDQRIERTTLTMALQQILVS